MMGEPRFYEFGEFRLDVAERVLWRDGEMIVLPPKVFETLQALVRKKGHIIDREALMDEVWGETVVEEGNLSVNVSLLRKTLGNDVIETIPRRGYRFSAPVREVFDGDEALGGLPKSPSALVTAEPEALPEPKPGEPLTASLAIRPKRVDLVLILATLAVAIAAIAGFWLYESSPRQATDSIAVLPFANVNGDSTTEYLSDGLSETLTNKLSQLPLKVIAQSSAFRYKGKEIDPLEVGRALNVQTLVMGRVAQRGENLVVNVELVDARDRTQIWGDQYNRRLSDVLVVQEEIAKEISHRLRVKLSGQAQQRLAKRSTESPEAYQLYLKGRYFAKNWTPEGFAKGTEYFNRAIAIDPAYALAYDGLAYCYYATNWWAPWRESAAKGKAFARKALELDDTLAEAHTSLGIVTTWLDYDWPTAEREFKRALELNPNYPSTHQWYGFLLLASGRGEQSIAEAARAVELDPVSGEANAALGVYLFYLRRYEEARRQLRATIELEPMSWFAHLYLARANEQRGEFATAISELEKTSLMEGAAPEVFSALGYAYAMSGRRTEAQKIIADLQAQAKSIYVAPYNFATVYAALGDKDQALAYLEQEYREGSYYLNYLKLDPELDGLRADPRFMDLVLRVGSGSRRQ